MKFELARELGMTVQMLDNHLGPDELIYWRAYLSKRPSSELASWLQVAALMRQLVALVTPKGKTPPAIEDLIPSFDF